MGTEETSRSCIRCGAALAPSAAFCRYCGARYTPPDPGASVAPEPPPAKERSGRRWGRAALIVAGALALVVASAGGTVLLLGQDDSGGGTAEEQVSLSSVPVESDVGSQESGAVGSGSTSSETPSQSSAQMASEIQSMLLAYYEDVVAERFRGAWAMLSARKRQQNLSEYTYRDWVEEGVAGLADYLDPSGLTVRIDGTEADGSVRVLLTGMTWSDPSSPCSEWSGLTWVKYEDGAWALDSGYSTTPERRRLWEPREDELLGVGC